MGWVVWLDSAHTCKPKLRQKDTDRDQESRRISISQHQQAPAVAGTMDSVTRNLDTEPVLHKNEVNVEATIFRLQEMAHPGGVAWEIRGRFCGGCHRPSEVGRSRSDGISCSFAPGHAWTYMDIWSRGLVYDFRGCLTNSRDFRNMFGWLKKWYTTQKIEHHLPRL